MTTATAPTDVLAAAIDAAVTRLLERASETTTDGAYRLSASELTKAIDAAVGWYAAKHKAAGDDGFGSAFGKNGGGRDG